MFLLTTQRCISCGKMLTRYENALCLSCHHKMARTFMLPRTRNLAEQRMEPLCDISWAYSHFFFNVGKSIAREVVRQFKYHNNPMLAFEMGLEVGSYMKQNGMTHLFDLIIPVPISWPRRFSRGYNQAAEFSRGLSEATGVEMRTDILRRRSWASSLTSRNAEQRAASMSEKAFVARRQITDIANRKVALVDDVLTTGSTLSACCRALRERIPEMKIGILTFSINQ